MARPSGSMVWLDSVTQSFKGCALACSTGRGPSTAERTTEPWSSGPRTLKSPAGKSRDRVSQPHLAVPPGNRYTLANATHNPPGRCPGLHPGVRGQRHRTGCAPGSRRRPARRATRRPGRLGGRRRILACRRGVASRRRDRATHRPRHVGQTERRRSRQGFFRGGRTDRLSQPGVHLAYRQRRRSTTGFHRCSALRHDRRVPTAATRFNRFSADR